MHFRYYIATLPDSPGVRHLFRVGDLSARSKPRQEGQDDPAVPVCLTCKKEEKDKSGQQVSDRSSNKEKEGEWEPQCEYARVSMSKVGDDKSRSWRAGSSYIVCNKTRVRDHTIRTYRRIFLFDLHLNRYICNNINRTAATTPWTAWAPTSPSPAPSPSPTTSPPSSWTTTTTFANWRQRRPCRGL